MAPRILNPWRTLWNINIMNIVRSQSSHDRTNSQYPSLTYRIQVFQIIRVFHLCGPPANSSRFHDDRLPRVDVGLPASPSPTPLPLHRLSEPRRLNPVAQLSQHSLLSQSRPHPVCCPSRLRRTQS